MGVGVGVRDFLFPAGVSRALAPGTLELRFRSGVGVGILVRGRGITLQDGQLPAPGTLRR